MGMDTTITEHSLDSESRERLHKLRSGGDEPDLDVDGLSDSLVARLKRFFAFGRA